MNWTFIVAVTVIITTAIVLDHKYQFSGPNTVETEYRTDLSRELPQVASTDTTEVK